MNQRRHEKSASLKLALAGAGLAAFARMTLLALALGSALAQAQQVTTLIQFTDVWKYDQSGLELGTAWRTNDYDDSAWPSGRGLLGFDDTPAAVVAYNQHAPINTPLIISSTVTTFYFRATFDFTGSTYGLSLVATNLVDDGCVIYLNGLRAGGVRALASYNATTFFGGPATEGQLDIITLTNLAALRTGRNLLAVEVHQQFNPSSDIMWGMRLMAIRQTPLAITNQPQGQTVVVGQPVTLSVGVSGGPAFYQWQRNGVNISNGTNATYSIPAPQLGSSADYRVIVANSISAVTSSVAIVTVVLDLTGPKLIAAIVANTAGGATFGSNTINVLFDEPMTVGLTGSGVRNSNNYTVTQLGTTNTVTILNVLYSAALGALLVVDEGDLDWVSGGDYVLTVNNVADLRGNVIAPDSHIGVAWRYSMDLITTDAIWDFHASAVFEPGVFDEHWFAADYAPSLWWAQAQGIFYGSPITTATCQALGTLRTQTGYQPEPTLYRTIFQWPAHWPPSGTLRATVAYDDAIVLYLDGKEIYRSNVGANGSPVGLASRADSAMNLCVTDLMLTVADVQPGVHCLAAAVPQVNVPTDSDSVFGLRMDAVAYFAPQLPEMPPPALDMTLPGTNAVRLAWTGGGFALESSTNLALAACRTLGARIF